MFVVSHGSSQGYCTASSVSSEVLQPSIRRGECSCTTACGLKLDQLFAKRRALSYALSGV